jgi:hypothetical protein
LRGLLAEIGYADALLARELDDGRLMLIDGHLRAETTPDARVPVLVLDVSAEEADKLLATLDPLASMAQADSERIKELLATVRTDSAAVAALLEMIAEQADAQIATGPVVDPEPQIDRAAQLQDKWGTAPSQMWQIGRHRLLCADNRQREKEARLWRASERFRVLWTDPPYGVAYAAKNGFLNQSDGGRVALLRVVIH